MKKLSLLLLGLFLMTPWISASRYVSGDPSIRTLIVKLEQELPGNFFTLRLANLQRMETVVSLTDANGKTLHNSQITKSNGHSAKFILQGVANGTYQLKIEWNDQSSVWQVFKAGKKIEFKPLN